MAKVEFREDLIKEFNNNASGPAWIELIDRIKKTIGLGMIGGIGGISLKVLEIAGISTVISSGPAIALFGAIGTAAGVGATLLLNRRIKWEEKRKEQMKKINDFKVLWENDKKDFRAMDEEYGIMNNESKVKKEVINIDDTSNLTAKDRAQQLEIIKES